MRAVPLYDEAEVLRLVAGGDERAFTLLFRRYSGKVYSFALRLTRSEEMSEEVVQEVFLRIWLNRDDLTEIQNFGAYLNRINRNYCLNAIKRLAHESRISLEISRSSSELSHDTEHSIAYNEAKERLEHVIEMLPPQQQQVYRLCQVEGLKYEEAAIQLNISPGTVHTHMKRALKAIREHLQDAGMLAVICGLIQEMHR